MQVKELIAQLRAYSPDDEVSISVDEEGNDFKGIDMVAEASKEEDPMGRKLKGAIIYPFG